MDHALGALAGAAVGDAVGAYLEFKGHIAPADVDSAMALPGGGCWDVGAGQFTDDTELALCLAHGLVGHPPSAGFPSESVAAQYAWWCNESRPFDIGRTTSAAMRVRGYPTPPGEGGFAAALLANAQNDASLKSQANGATMRSTPLAIWAHRLPPPAVAAAARFDALLSHPSLACQDASAAYVLACAWLVAHPGDAEGALAAAEGWAGQHACGEVRSWVEAARDDGAMQQYDASPAMGWVRHGLMLALYHLRRRSPFEDGLRHALLCGGDTDTNAAIVGGLLGALHGASAIPSSLLSTVEAGCWDEWTFKGHQRPEKLWGSQLRPLATRLYEEAAANAEQTGGASSA